MMPGQSKYSWEKKVEAVTTYLAVGNMNMVAGVVRVPAQTLRVWKMQPWWKELEAELRHEEAIQTNQRLKKIVDKSLDHVLDRIVEGDFQYDPKTGKMIRRPVLLRDAAKVAVEMMTRQDMLKQIQVEKMNKVSVEDALKKIADEFAKIARGDNGTKLQERVPELPGEARADQEPGAEERGASGDGREDGEEYHGGRGPQDADLEGGLELEEQPADPEPVAEQELPADEVR